MKIEFKPVPNHGDTWSIEVFKNGKSIGWIKWIDLPAERIVRISDLVFAWSASKSQAEQGAKEAQELYDTGRVR